MTMTRARQRLLWLARRVRRGVRAASLAELEDSRRPLLFSLLPRMVRGDGTAPRSLQRAFRYVEQGLERVSAVTVSSQRWSRALATSRRLAARRVARGPIP